MLQYQYNLVKDSRSVLLDYCETLKPEDLLKENSSFGRGSIRNLLVHICNTYESWIGLRALTKDIVFTTTDEVPGVSQCRTAFKNADLMMDEFIFKYKGIYPDDINIEWAGSSIAASPLKLFSHVISHEFHHKGQILSLSRHLGYIPVDTDIMR